MIKNTEIKYSRREAKLIAQILDAARSEFYKDESDRSGSFKYFSDSDDRAVQHYLEFILLEQGHQSGADTDRRRGGLAVDYLTDAEYDQAEVELLASDYPERAWLSSSRDVWYPNPSLHWPASATSRMGRLRRVARSRNRKASTLSGLFFACANEVGTPLALFALCERCAPWSLCG
jgi:hypothetical protein